jgi:6-phosphogluconolactonase
MSPPITRRFATQAELDEAFADHLQHALSAAPLPSPTIMLAGGMTPVTGYLRVAARRPRPHPQLQILYSDDRYVPPSSPASNYGRSLPLLQALALPPERVLRVRTELPIAQARADYEHALGELLQREHTVGLGLMGLGADGHTASLFSDADLQRAQGRLAIDVHRTDGMEGVSVTPEFLTHVQEILFVVSGADKRNAVAEFLARSPRSIAWRAVQNAPRVELWADAAALDEPR